MCQRLTPGFYHFPRLLPLPPHPVGLQSAITALLSDTSRNCLHPADSVAGSVSRGVLQQAARATKSVTQMTHHICAANTSTGLKKQATVKITN